MEQVLHIFRKDVRHFWIEVTIAQALLVLHGWNEVRSWSQPNNMAFAFGGIFGYEFLSRLSVLLLPAAWVFLIVRIFHDESLVGDRQFWITRPYEWVKLLAAKLLFIVSFISVPVFALQIVLLAFAGFAPLQYLSGLLSMHLLNLLFLLPVLVLASVTASLAQFGLAILCVALSLAGLAYLSSLIASSTFGDPSEALEFFLFLAVCVAVLLLQYSRRSTLKSRLLIIGLGILVTFIMVTSPYGYYVNHEYPPLSVSESAPLHLALNPTSKPSEGNLQWDPQGDPKEVTVRFPLTVTSIASDTIVDIRGKLVTIDLPDGFRWNSGWESGGIPRLYPDDNETLIDVTMKRKDFERMANSTVRVRLALAMSVYRDENRRPFVVPKGEFALVDSGRCRTLFDYSHKIHCLVAPKRQPSLLITEDFSESTCPLGVDEKPADRGMLGHDWTYGTGDEEPGISPVRSLDIYASAWDRRSTRMRTGVCPGTPLVLSNPRELYKRQMEVEFDGMRLADYIPKMSTDLRFSVK